jgi:outer membrane protein assembly factor BamB
MQYKTNITMGRGSFVCKQSSARGKGLHLFITLFFTLVLLLMAACNPAAPNSTSGVPVEPIVADQEGINSDAVLKGRFSIINPEMNIYALDVSSSGSDILFSSDTGSVSMLDDHGRLRWEIFLEGLPTFALLTTDGNFAAVGTDKGKVFLLDNKGQIIWKEELDGIIELLSVAPGGEYLAVSLEKEQKNILRLYDRFGNLIWERFTAPLLKINLFATGELYYLEKGEKNNTLLALDDRGGELWSLPLSQVSFSSCGYFAVAGVGEQIYYYSLKEEDEPAVLWNVSPGAEITWFGLTENGENVVAYSAPSCGSSNLFAYDKSGTLLWERKIPAGALLQVSRFGRRIVATSWQEYSEDFSKVLVLDAGGETLQELEMTSRINKMAFSDDGSILALAGSDGNIFVLDISVPVTEKNGDEAQEKSLYSQVIMGNPAGEQYLTLYFYDEQALHLIPVNRNIKATANIIQMAVDELIKGPCRLSGLSRTIPKDAAINATFEDGIASIELPEELTRLFSPAQKAGIIDSLLLTISQFSFVNEVRFIIGGEETKIFSPRRLEKEGMLFFIPHRVGERYYLLPREVVKLKDKINTPDSLVNTLLDEYRVFFPELPQVKKVYIKSDEIILDWDSSFRNIFFTEAGAERRELVALIVDSLLLTLAGNLEPPRLQFFVEGVPWMPPAEYAHLNLELKRPFYINPE